VPVCLTQRAWSGMLLCLAFGGALLLARALGVGSRPARYVGALAYALAPRMLTEVGTLSAEMLPAALLPWVLLPLVRVDRIGSPRRAAALSALAVLAMGGINGAMVIMSLVLPGIYLLTRRFTRAHLVMTGYLVAAGYLFFWVVVGRDPTPHAVPRAGRVALLAVGMTLQAFLGLVLTLSTVVLAEDWFVGLYRAWGPAPLDDQRAAGRLLFSIGLLPALLALVAVLTGPRGDPAGDRTSDHGIGSSAPG